MTLGHAKHLRALIEKTAATLDDETALTGIELFPAWAANVTYSVGDRVRYDGLLYKCLTVHIAQGTWTPDVSPSLWARVAEPEEWPEWIQPIGAETAYHKGDKVSHNGTHWVSDIDNNVWEPGVYGWS